MELLKNLFSGHVMVIAPHYDDEVIGCGGSLLKHRKYIEKLSIVHLAGCPIRINEFSQIKYSYNVSYHNCLNLEDGYINNMHGEAVKSLVDIIQEIHPNLVFLPHKDDNHPDHSAANDIALDAINKASFWKPNKNGKIHKVDHILEYEVWFPIKNPSIVVDISEVFEEKKQALSNYASQIKDFNYYDYLSFLNGWRSLVYKKSGKAEAFRIKCL